MRVLHLMVSVFLYSREALQSKMCSAGFCSETVRTSFRRDGDLDLALKICCRCLPAGACIQSSQALQACDAAYITSIKRAF